MNQQLKQQPWIVIGVYCDGIGKDGAATRHDPVPVFNYRRVELDDGPWWLPIYSSNDYLLPLDNQQVWLDVDSNVSPHRSSPDDRAHETFQCPNGDLSVRVRWEDVEKALDAAYAVPVPRIMLRQWREQKNRHRS